MEQVFSRAGQLSEVNSDFDGLTVMVSIMLNKSSVKDIMDKYYEMFRSKNHSEANKKDFSNSPDQSDQDSHADG